MNRKLIEPIQYKYIPSKRVTYIYSPLINGVTRDNRVSECALLPALCNYKKRVQLFLPLLPPPVHIIDLSGPQNIVDVCLQETGGLGVHCVIDNGGMYIYTGKLSIVRLKFFKECDLCSPPFVYIPFSFGWLFFVRPDDRFFLSEATTGTGVSPLYIRS